MEKIVGKERRAGKEKRVGKERQRMRKSPSQSRWTICHLTVQ
jgi:hypothetical protein